MPRKAASTALLEKTQATEQSAEFAERLATVGTPDDQGRWKVELPDLPPQALLWLRNKSTARWIFETPDTAPIFLGPLDEIPLENADTWLLHTKFRECIQGGHIEVYRRMTDLPLPQEPPLRLAVDERYKNTVAQFCFGSVEEAIELMQIEPRLGSGAQEILDIDFLLKDWVPVLSRALWILRELRRCGREVDQRRIDALEARLAWIEEMRVEMKSALV